ncbi:MAG: heavy metal translocating P-type ATPase [Clostridia bacterium]|nr:heavy metal translocating P-type ATPase [Clostridia bacterium]
MKQFNVTGMSCAACSARVEKAVSNIDGVKNCSVNLLTNSMSVEGEIDPSVIIEAVKKAGYGASLKGTKILEKNEIDKNTTALKRRLIFSAALLLILMYVSMGHIMWGWWLPTSVSSNYLLLGYFQLVVTLIILILNKSFFVNGIKGLLHLSPNMDTLVALGSSAALVYSSIILGEMTYSHIFGDYHTAAHFLHQFYFESAAMIVTLITIGKMLESKSKGKTTNALKSLMDLKPKSAVVLKDGKEITVAIDEVCVDDIFIVRAGDSISVDGIVIEGDASVNESALTGESIPVYKGVSDSVSAATVSLSGYLKCRATRVGEDTTLAKIIKMVSDASATKAPIAKAADKVSGVFVPVVIVLAIITTIAWLLMGNTIGFALARGISVLVISCPCALGLATPVAIMVGNGVGAKNGILFKNATSLEILSKIKVIAFDKTGTITQGKPQVTDIIPFGEIKKEQLLIAAYSLEAKSEHPLAKAICDYCRQHNIMPQSTEDFKSFSGKGVLATCNGKEISGGNFDFINKKVEIPKDIKETINELSVQGKTVMLFAEENCLLGLIFVSDIIKEDSADAVKDLKKMGIEVYMLTGDDELTAQAIGKKVGIDNVIAQVLPDGKEQIIRKLKEKGRVAMVGDGINDAPALTSADVGIAIGKGTDIAIDSADIVLVENRLSHIIKAINLSRGTLRNIRQNLFWAFFYNALGIPLAAGVFIKVLGWQLNPMFAAAAMSLSSFCVVSNALRLNFIKLDRKKEKKKMVITLNIEGMMCPHCSGRVKTVLEGIDGVVSADVSHERKNAIITLEKDVPNEILVSAIEKEGYKVI